MFGDQSPVVQRVANMIQWINLYPLDSTIGFLDTYPLSSDLSSGQCYPTFEHLGPELSTINPLLSPPLSNNPPPSNKPPLFRGRKLISPPPSLLSPPPLPYLFFTNNCQTVSINHDCKTLCGLIQDSLFTNWKIGFDSDPRLHDPKILVLELFHLAFQFFMEN